MKRVPSVIDAHAHCGVQDSYPPQSFESYHALVAGSDITGVVMFAPVAEIYDRYDPGFEDNKNWQMMRKRANEYLLGCGSPDLRVYPYFFIWNDFAVDQLTPQHLGIKWHRHDDEPVYHYHDPGCKKAIDEIRKRKMPVVLEEELENTVAFINEMAHGVRVIIPHLGVLNGGYRSILDQGLWENPDVYADTALAASHEIIDYIERFGHERLMFGSDFPFGTPKSELKKIRDLKLDIEVEKAILGGNFLTLLSCEE